MLDCFDGLVTLDNACASQAGVLPLQAIDIDETLIAQFTGSEETVESLLVYAEKQARLVISHDALTFYARRIIPTTFIDRKQIGEPDEDQELMSGTGIGGILVEINQPRSNVVLAIGSLGLYATTTGDVTITIYDLEDGSVAATHTLEAVADRSVTESVQIALPAYRKRKAYFITHDLTDFYRTDTHSSCGSCYSGYQHGGVTINGGRLDTALSVKSSNIRRVSHTSGLSALITVACDHSQMLCENKNVFAWPYLNKVGEIIMRKGIQAVERMNSERLNIDILKDRRNQYGAQYAEAMRNTLANMRPPDDHMCFTCDTPTRIRTVLP